MKRNRPAPLMLVALAAAALVGGCGNNSGGLSDGPPKADEVKAFKGGPMPPEARAKMEQSMRGGAANGAASSDSRAGR